MNGILGSRRLYGGSLTANNAMPQDIAYGAPRESWNETREVG